MAPVHFALAVQGGAQLLGGLQQRRVAGGVQRVLVQHGKAALGLGTEVVTDGQVNGFAGHVRDLEAGEQPQIDLRATLMEIGQARQQPVPGERRAGVDHQLIGLAVLVQATDADRQVLQQRLRGAEQVMPGIGQADAAATAVEQWLFQVGFQAANLLADRRLGEVQCFGGLVEAAKPRGGFKTPERVERWPVFEHDR